MTEDSEGGLSLLVAIILCLISSIFRNCENPDIRHELADAGP